MIIKVRGLIVSETSYQDTSKIINIITPTHGIVGIMCKGAKSMKSKLRSSTTRFTYGDFHLYYKEKKLSTLIAVDIVDEFRNLKTDITLLSYLTYMTDFTNQVMKHSPNASVFALFIEALTKMNEGLNPKVICNILEIKFLEELGISLNLDACVICGGKTQIVTIAADDGGFICRKCYRNQLVVHPKTIKMLRMYYYVDIKSITKIDISSDIINEINSFLYKYYERYTGLYLYSKSFLEKIS